MSDYILPTYARININFTHGKGAWLFSNKKKYLDFAAGIAVNSLGHANPVLKKALISQARKLWHTSNLYKINEQEKVAEYLCNLSFAEKVFFCNSGAEATDGAIKIMRKYHYAEGNKKKNKIIVFENAFHGRTLTGILAGSNISHRQGFLPNIKSTGGFLRVGFNDIEAFKKSIDKNTAGVFIEPIQGEGGINVASIKYLREIKKICRKNKILLAFDEVQSGIGRTGKFFAHQWGNIKPDLLTSAKGLGGGFPVGAILVNNKLAKHMKPGSHGSTFGGNQLASAVSLAVIKEISKKKLLNNVILLGKYLENEIKKIIISNPSKIDAVFGKGLMLGIKCKVSNILLCQEFRKKGLLVVPAANNVLRLLPPLNISKKEATIAINKINEVVSGL